MLEIPSWLSMHYGDVHKVPSFVFHNSEKIDFSRIVLQRWLAAEKNSLLDRLFPDNSALYHICTDRRDLYVLEMARKKGKKIKLLISQKMLNSDLKEELESYGDCLEAYAGSGIGMCGTRMGKNILVKDRCDNVNSGLMIIEKSKPVLINTFMDYFNEKANSGKTVY